MDPEFKNREQEPFVIREQDNSSRTIWYTLIVILFLSLVGWYGYTAGWFGSVAAPEINNNTPNFSEEDFQEEVVNNFAPIDSVEIRTLDAFPIQQVVVIRGTLPNGCTYVNEPVQLRDGNIFYVTIDSYVEGEICTDALVPYERQIVLNTANLPAGVYIVNVNGRELSFEFESDNTLDFSAGEDK